MAIEPVTREELFLAAAGGRSVTPPTPITRKEQLLQGIIDAVKSGGATPDVIEGAVNDYLNANPVQPGATAEQAAQIEQNKTDIADLQNEIDNKQPKGDYVKTVNGNKPDASGNVVVPTGGNGSGENPGQDGATFIPAVSEDGTLSWTNDKGLDNPEPVNIIGPVGPTGAQGNPGKDGADGLPGAPGADGKDGHTPVKGVDYFTEDEVQEIAGIAAGMVEVPEGGGGSADWAIFADITTTEGVGIIKGTIPEAAKEVLLFFNCPAVETEIGSVKYGVWLDDSSRYTERRQWNSINVGETQTSQAYFIRFGDMFTCLSGISSKYQNLSDFRAGNGYDPVAGNTFIICSPYGTTNFPIGTTVKAYWR